jgi:hypothetical protein
MGKPETQLASEIRVISAYIDECSLHILAVKQIRRLLSLQPESDL